MKLNPVQSRKLIIFSWATYNFASTIFSMNVITLYFALWVVVDMHGEDIYYSFALSGSMLFSALSAPIFGAISDKIGKRMPFLILFTILSCIFTALIGFSTNIVMGLIAFSIANFGYQLSNVFYDTLLASVSQYKKIGQVSGIGVGFGYFGTILGLVLVGPFALHYGRPAAFIPTAILFFLFSLPCFIFVKDKRSYLRNKIVSESRNTIITAFAKIKETVVNIKKYSEILRFLIAAFIFLNAIDAVFIFMSVYAKRVVGFGDSEILVLYIFSSVFAILGAFSIGVITDKLGAKRTLMGVLCLWCVAAFLVIISWSKYNFYIIGPLVGISLGGTWTASRTMLVDLAPVHMIGEFFGFYGLIGKTAAIVGSLIWGICVLVFGFLGMLKYRIAVTALLLFLIIGLVILQKVPTKKVHHG
jgi:UMF1 family MFS transporter